MLVFPSTFKRNNNRGCFYLDSIYLVFSVVVLLVSSIASVHQVQAESSSSGVSSMDNHAYGNLSPTIFAPGGRLFSVENTMRAIQQDSPQNNLVIALQCRHGDIVVVTSQVTSPYLCYLNATTSASNTTTTDNKNEGDDDSVVVTSSVASSAAFPSLELPADNHTGIARPPFLRLATRLWGITAGPATDAQLLRLQLQGVVEQLRYREGDGSMAEEMDSLTQPAVVARALADVRQRATQQSGDNHDNNDDYGLLNATALIFSSAHNKNGNNNGGDLWRVDPTGQFFACQAAVVGRKADVAEADLMQRLKEKRQKGMLEQEQGNNHKTATNETGHSSDSDNEDTKAMTSQQLRDLVANLSPQDAMQIAKECIRRTLEPKKSYASKQSNINEGLPPPLFLRAFCLSSSSSSGKNTAKWYSHQDLCDN